ncbi:MAG: PilN domain-containing protein [Pseudomonadota bacterium]
MESASSLSPASGIIPSSIHGVCSRIYADILCALNAITNWLSRDTHIRIHTDMISERVFASHDRITLVAPKSSSLQPTLRLPLAADRHLPAIVKNKIHELTPFSPDGVYYGWTKPVRGEGKLTTSLIAMQRATADGLIARAESFGFAVDRLEIEGVEGVDILPSEPTANRLLSFLDRKQRQYLLSALAILLFAFVGAPLLRYAYASLTVASSQAGVESVVEARRVVAGIVADNRALHQLREGEAPVAALLNELASALDDLSWAQRILITPETLELRGVSKNASAALSSVDALPTTSNTELTSTVSVDPATGNERFQLKATLEPKQ